MKKILITGKTGYIGKSFADWVKKSKQNDYDIVYLDLRNNHWEEQNFFDVDVVLHLAAIVHKKLKDERLYFDINRDLTFKLATKAKREGVKQFVFLSTMAVYSLDNTYIDRNTEEKPDSIYATSKLEAETLIKTLSCKTFRIAILRPPFVYGENCKGNYQRLRSLALNLPVFPEMKNVRSMLYIDNLCEFIRLIIDENDEGTFFPQNQEYVCTTDMVSSIRRFNGKRIVTTKIFNWLIPHLFWIKTVKKVFGNLVYEHELSKYKTIYDVKGFLESIHETERRKMK